MISFVFCSGFELSFWQAQYPTIVGGKEDRVSLPDFKPSYISYLLLVVGVAEISGLKGKVFSQAVINQIHPFCGVT